MFRKMFALSAALIVGLLGMAEMVSAQHGDCCSGHGHKQKKVCKAETEVKKKAIVYYDCVKEDFCLPHCSRKQKACDPCDPCGHAQSVDCPKCERRARTKNVLIKKIRYEDECVTKCTPVDDCCDTCIGGSCAVEMKPAPAPVPVKQPEPIPAPKLKEGGEEGVMLPVLPQ